LNASCINYGKIGNAMALLILQCTVSNTKTSRCCSYTTLDVRVIRQKKQLLVTVYHVRLKRKLESKEHGS